MVVSTEHDPVDRTRGGKYRALGSRWACHRSAGSGGGEVLTQVHTHNAISVKATQRGGAVPTPQILHHIMPVSLICDIIFLVPLLTSFRS